MNDDQTEGTELATLENAGSKQQGGALSPLASHGGFAMFGDRPRAFAHNFDGNAVETLKFISAAKQGEHESLQDSNGAILTVHNFYVHAVELEHEDGEIVASARSVLFCKGGKSYECVSGGIFECLRDAATVFSPADWKAGVKFKVASKKTRKGFRIMTLQPV